MLPAHRAISTGSRNVFVLGGASPTGELDVRRAAFTVLLDQLDHSLLYKLAEARRRSCR